MPVHCNVKQLFNGYFLTNCLILAESLDSYWCVCWKASSKKQSNIICLECKVKPNFSHSILLSFVSGEDTQDRTDRVMLTPWVKFLWEAYRNVLELLRNNVRVEKLYHDTAQQGLFDSNLTFDWYWWNNNYCFKQDTGSYTPKYTCSKTLPSFCKGGVCKILKFNNCDKRNKTIWRKTLVNN